MADCALPPTRKESLKTTLFTSPTTLLTKPTSIVIIKRKGKRNNLVS